jgi:hypothetical protein
MDYAKAMLKLMQEGRIELRQPYDKGQDTVTL